MTKLQLQEMHQQEIADIKNSIDALNKPAFSAKDKASFLIGFFIYTIILTVAFNTVDNRSLHNKERIDKIEHKIDKIYDILIKQK